jgi:hypothetical protein
VEYNLTQRERQILVRLLELSQHSKEQFEARVNASPEAPAREVARLHFAGGVQTMEVTKRDLRVLKDEGLIHFRWHAPDRGAGRLASLAFEAVSTNFQGTTNQAALSAAAAATASALVLADEKAIALRFQKITSELVNLTRELIDADEAQAADHEARSIAEELAKPQPDETVITRKAKGFVSRLSLTFSGTADLASKGEMIGEFGERLAAWLVALSVWTEWHAAHHPKPDPCA